MGMVCRHAKLLAYTCETDAANPPGQILGISISECPPTTESQLPRTPHVNDVQAPPQVVPERATVFKINIDTGGVGVR